MNKYKVVIPARGGSKRFPKKNLAILNGKPLLHHTILYALEYFSKEDIWLNSDEDEILKEGIIFGIQTCKRPILLGSDTTPTSEVLKFQVEFFEERHIKCDAIILLQVTNPIRPKLLLKHAIELYELHGRKSLATFSPLNKKYGTIINNYYKPTNYKPGQRIQDIPTEYYENGLLYIINSISVKKNVIITDDVYPMVINSITASVDIDEPTDMTWASFVSINYNGI